MGEPYREMPLPLGPPRDWRRTVRFVLGAFNMLMAALAVLSVLTLSIHSIRFWGGVLMSAAACASLGFLGPWRRHVRAILVLPSAAGWAFASLRAVSLDWKADDDFPRHPVLVVVRDASGVLLLLAVAGCTLSLAFYWWTGRVPPTRTRAARTSRGITR